MLQEGRSTLHRLFKIRHCRQRCLPHSEAKEWPEPGKPCGVEGWRGGLGGAYPFAGPFVCRCLNSLTMLRFHLPLIEPDRRISRIRLSEKDSRVRPRKAARSAQ